MAKRTYQQKAYVVIDRCDKSRTDTTFYNFVLESLYLTLQEIVTSVPYARWLENEVSITTAASAQYVDLSSSGIDPDNIVDIRDETNNFSSRRITAEEAGLIDPGRDLTGDEFLWWLQTVSGAPRIYFINKPDSIDTLKVICGAPVTDPTAGTTSVLPAKYESVEIDGALSKVWERIDPNSPLSDKYYKRFLGGYNDAGEATGMCAIIRDAKKARGQMDSLASHRPNTGSDFAPRFPASFDINP